MWLMDSASRTKINLNEQKINIYLCGPTVYDDAHLGHARSSVCFDLLRRVLLALGKEPYFVRNYTDIDDKILKKMQEQNQSLADLTENFIQSYEKDMKELRVLEPNLKPRATHFIAEILALIKKLDERGFVYTLRDGLYFDTSKDKGYLSLSQRTFEDTQSRLEKQVDKKNESDFVLWKFDENFYESEFGKGRPGWHSECVAMIEALFSGSLHIHAGGIDLFFPHHENEAAQCRCVKNQNLAKIWLHNGFVKIDGEKMSKSLNNSFFIKDALKNFMGENVRLYLLSVHYRAHFNYALEDLEAAKKRLDKFYRLKKRLDLGEFQDFKEEKISFKTSAADEVLECLKDDLNISKALALLDEFIVCANLKLDKKPKDKDLKEDLAACLEELALIFGFGFLDANLYFQWGVSEEQKAYIQKLIFQRNEAKINKDYQKADLIRAELSEQGISLLDTAKGTIWEKNNV